MIVMIPRKALPFFFCALLLTGLAACSKSGEESAPSPSPAEKVPLSESETAPQVAQATQPPAQPQGTPARKETPAPSPLAPRTPAAAIPDRPVAEPSPVRTAAPAPEPEPLPEDVPDAVPPPPPLKVERVATPPSAPRPINVTLPAGTVVEVRLDSALSSTRNEPGDRFEAVLDSDLAVDGKIVASRGSRVIGKLPQVVPSGRVEGRAHMSLALAEIEIGEKTYPIETNTIVIEAEGTAGRDAKAVGGAAGLGALIGGLAGGKKGAAIGAAVGGGGATAAVLVTKGKEVELEPEQKFSFRLEKQIELPVR